MNTVSLAPESDPLFRSASAERPFYATGMLLGADDFLAEQSYHRGRLAHLAALTTGGGTLAGLRVSHAVNSNDTEEIRVDAGVAIDRLGRLVEVSRPACLRLDRWWKATREANQDAFATARYDNFSGFMSPRAQSETASLPVSAVIADVFLRFVACRHGLTPSFASGPYDALDAVATSRLEDAYELLLIPRPGLDNDDPAEIHSGLPARGPDLASLSDDAARGAAVQDAILDAWPKQGRSASAADLAPLAEHPIGLDPTAQFLARVLLPVTAGSNPVERQSTAVVVDNWSRRWVPSSQLIQRWLSI